MPTLLDYLQITGGGKLAGRGLIHGGTRLHDWAPSCCLKRLGPLVGTSPISGDPRAPPPPTADLWSGFPPASRQGTADMSRRSWLSRLDVLSPSGWRPGRRADTPRHPMAPGAAPATRGPSPVVRSDPPATPPQETQAGAALGFYQFYF